jgi:hypothetical protein
LIALGLATYSCADLEVINETAPDAARALANPEDVKSLAGGGLRSVMNQMNEYESVTMAMEVMADHSTCSWGNSAMRDMSWEPRINSFNNNLTYSYFPTIRSNWNNTYSAISAVNSVLQQMYAEEGGVDFEDETAMVEAFSYFVSGVSHGWLGLTYDQANIILWDTDLLTLELKPWEEVIAASLTMIDKAIEIADANTFTVPVKWLAGAQMTNVEFSELANSWAARIMASQSRTKAHNDALDWTKIKTYAQNGLSEDWIVEVGDAYDWYDMAWVYLRYPGWGRVDHRIINQMDHNYPSRWPTNGIWPNGDPEEADATKDARIASDFQYLPSNAFPPDRGYYHFSHYRFSRYDYLSDQAWYGIGPKPMFMAWECQLLIAEAEARAGNEAAARDILNNADNPRKLRGQCADVTASGAELLRYITDEKDIECFLTGAGVPFFDMRRFDRLQPATLLHFPVPATELEINQLDHYTINAVADGVQGSNGDWTGWDD